MKTQLNSGISSGKHIIREQRLYVCFKGPETLKRVNIRHLKSSEFSGFMR